MSDTLTYDNTVGPIQFYCHVGTQNTLGGALPGNYFEVVPGDHRVDPLARLWQARS